MGQHDVSTDERETLRELAGKWMELASLPAMAERRHLWTALNDLHAERPMVLFETLYLEDYVAEEELACQDPFLRDVERRLRWTIRHAEEVGDDLVVEPFWRVYWEIERSDYGVDICSAHAEDMQGGHVGYAFQHPIRTPDDISRLHPRTCRVHRARTRQRAEKLQSCFGDILPVVLHGTGRFHAGLTQDLYKLISNANLLTWIYDAPQALHDVMAVLRDDRLAFFDWLEREGLLGFNHTGWELVGSGSPGYTSALPQAGCAGAVRLRDLWVWMESQETSMVSPAMFEEFFLPYMAAVCGRFGFTYYGCCEPLHDRWGHIRRAIPNVRAVSISPWSNLHAMAERLGKDYVYSRKPKPWPISGENADWDALRQDVDDTLAAARNCNLAFVYRDVYRIGRDRNRLSQWVRMVRSRMNHSTPKG